MQFKSLPMAEAITIFRMLQSSGVNPQNIYCQSTGAPIGQLSGDEWFMLWESLDPKMDAEEIMDELFSRTIACMRPSPAWNYIRRDTLNRLRITNPTRLAAWLLGRYYEPRDPAYSRVKRTFESRIDDGINRIQIYHKLMTGNYDKSRVREFVTILLMVDSAFDLSVINMIHDFPKSPLDLNFDVLENYMGIIHEAYVKLAAHKAHLEKKAQLDSSILARGGNRMTREVSHKAFMETKPKSEAVVRKESRNQAAILMENLLRELMNDESKFIERPVITAKPMRVGFKMGAK